MNGEAEYQKQSVGIGGTEATQTIMINMGQKQQKHFKQKRAISIIVFMLTRDLKNANNFVESENRKELKI